MDEKGKDEKSENVSVKSCNAKGFLQNYWAIATFVLGLLLVLSFFSGGCPTGAVASKEQVGEDVIDFVKSFGDEATLVSVESYEDSESLYEVMLSIEGQEFPVYVTKDGETLVLEPIPLTGFAAQEPVAQEPVAQESQQNFYSEEELAELKKFNDCLSENGMVIYGAEWCPHCSNLVDFLGGRDAVDNLYVDCEENSLRCNEEMIGGGIPEIQVNGEFYEGARDLESFAQETDCQVPNFV